MIYSRIPVIKYTLHYAQTFLLLVFFIMVLIFYSSVLINFYQTQRFRKLFFKNRKKNLKIL